MVKPSLPLPRAVLVTAYGSAAAPLWAMLLLAFDL